MSRSVIKVELKLRSSFVTFSSNDSSLIEEFAEKPEKFSAVAERCCKVNKVCARSNVIYCIRNEQILTSRLPIYVNAVSMQKKHQLTKI